MQVECWRWHYKKKALRCCKRWWRPRTECDSDIHTRSNSKQLEFNQHSNAMAQGASMWRWGIRNNRKELPTLHTNRLCTEHRKRSASTDFTHTHTRYLPKNLTNKRKKRNTTKNHMKEFLSEWSLHTCTRTATTNQPPSHHRIAHIFAHIILSGAWQLTYPNGQRHQNGQPNAIIMWLCVTQVACVWRVCVWTVQCMHK